MKFYNELFGFNMTLGAAFNDNQEMAATAGAPGASFRQSSARIPGTSVPIVTTGGEPVEVAPGVKVSLVRDPNNMLIELIQAP